MDHHEWCSNSLCLSIVGLAEGINLSYTHSASVELTTQWEGISSLYGCLALVDDHLVPYISCWLVAASPPTVNLTVSKSECTYSNY